ncbi:MAG TPA: hypothetical protein PKC22_00835 [Rhodocyclaceae bacterium]|nr:hypothetical protein [Rhodocyclaceae bacterium]
MKTFFKNLGLGVPLAFGVMLTLVGVSLVIQRTESDEIVGGIICGLIGIPLLFATLAAILKD